MKSSSILILSCLLILLLPLGVAMPGSLSEGKISIGDVEVKGKMATVTFNMSNPHSPELMEVIKSGIEVKFEYQVVVERVHKNWFDPNVGYMRVDKVIRYDPISNEYSVYSSLGEERKYYKDLGRAAEEFFGERELAIPLSGEVIRGKKYDVSVRARIDEMEVAGIFRHVPVISGWFEVKTDWERVRVNAR